MTNVAKIQTNRGQKKQNNVTVMKLKRFDLSMFTLQLIPVSNSRCSTEGLALLACEKHQSRNGVYENVSIFQRQFLFHFATEGSRINVAAMTCHKIISMRLRPPWDNDSRDPVKKFPF